MERSALKAVINLIEISQLVEFTELLEHRDVEECMALFKSNSIYRKTQKEKLIQIIFLHFVDLQEPYTALISMSMIWRMGTPSTEDRQAQHGASLLVGLRLQDVHHLSPPW